METSNPKWGELLRRAVEEPGYIHQAYSHFHSYSVGNQVLALCQCYARNITPGPIATFPGWLSRGRHVKRGEKAITLCMPLTFKKRAQDGDEGDELITAFVYKPHWFVLSQTDGDAYDAPPVPDWDQARALDTLDIAMVPFDYLDGNAMGYARGRTVAVSPLAFSPHKTLFHELGHILLGHTDIQADGERLPRDLREVEAESVALIVCSALGLGDEGASRGYVQHWLRQGGKDAIPERSAQRIFQAADKILKAGRPVNEERQAA